MVVTLLYMELDFPGNDSLKGKRKYLQSIKEKCRLKFHLSIAEVGFQDKHNSSALGAALVSNSRKHGESVMNKAINFVEERYALRISNIMVHSESYLEE